MMNFKAKTNIPEEVKKKYGSSIDEETYEQLSFSEKRFYYEVEEPDLSYNNISCGC